MPKSSPPATAEHARLAEATGRAEDDLFSANPWYEWGPYLSERAWGTVREDYSEGGDAWDSFPHDHARSRAYRWNEDGMAGISDIRHELCLALALWNGKDPILKERMFGLTGPQGNHGEDVKEYWWYLEGLPSHALLRWRYHYPQAAFPYDAARPPRPRPPRPRARAARHRRVRRRPLLVGRRHLREGLADRDPRCGSRSRTTGRTRRRWTCCRRSGSATRGRGATTRRARGSRATARRSSSPTTRSPATGSRPRPAPTARRPRRSSARTRRTRRASSASEATTPYPKDGINDHVVSGAATVNPDGVRHEGGASLPRDRARRRQGRAAAAAPPPGRREQTANADWAGGAFDEVVAAREADADEFYARARAGRARRRRQMQILRQACAGLVWSKQMYPYNVRRWLDGDPGEPPPPEARQHGRNSDWRHLDSFDVLAMPDPWEYPWFAAWDLGFHAIPWAHLDPAFAKYQLLVLLREWFQHPNGALPAYEWNFDDVNPPVHVMAALRVFRDRRRHATASSSSASSRSCWSTSRGGSTARTPTATTSSAAASSGSTTSARSTARTCPEGVALEQADGTAWMAYYALSMLVIAIELARGERRLPGHGDQVPRAVRADRAGARPAGPLRRRRRVLLRPARVPVGRVDAGEGADDLGPDPGAAGRRACRRRRSSSPSKLGKRFARLREGWEETGGSMVGRVRETRRRADACSLSVINPDDLRRTLEEFFDEAAFLSPHGLRAVSKRYEGQPVHARRRRRARGSTTSPPSRPRRMFGGNSNWRGPDLDAASTTSPSASSSSTSASSATTSSSSTRPARASERTFGEIAQDLADRLVSIWLPGAGRPPPGLRRHREAPDGPGLEGQPDLQRVLPRRQRRRPRRDPPDRLDGARRRPDPRPARVRPGSGR